jgi:hypothetical protein
MMPATATVLPVSGTVARDSAGAMLVLSQRLEGHDTFLTGLLDAGDGPRIPVRILTFDDVTVLRLAGDDPAPGIPGGRWSAVLHLPHGQRPRVIPPDLAEAARRGRRDLTVLDTAELRYALTFLGEATTTAIRQARIDAILTVLPVTRVGP